MSNLLFALCAIIIGVGILGVLLRRNILKMIIALSVIDYGVNMFIITRGYVDSCTAPILPAPAGQCMVDPIPQALTLTSIVIGASVTALALGLAIGLYRHKKTLEIKMVEK
ncbi:MAG: cation:proton antiporter subunit C [Candidatus Micrarchaeota archaeon]